MFKWMHVETQKVFLLHQVVILMNMFLWFPFGPVLQPVTFRIDPPETTIGNGFPILTKSTCFPCHHQDFSHDHIETSSLLNPFHHFILILTVSNIEK